MTQARFWDKIAQKYAQDPISDIEAYTDTLELMRAIVQPQHRVLELGCGTGSTALELAGGVAGYTGTDFSAEMIAIARAKQDETTPEHLRFAVRGAADISPGAQDAVIALNLLHLLPDLDPTIAAIHAGLPAGGVFISKTPLLGQGAWFLPLMIPLMRAIGKAPFVRNLTEADLITAIETAGFRISETLLQPGRVPRLFVVAIKA